MKDKIYNPQDNISNPHIKDFDQYKAMYEESINNPKSFFGNMAKDNLNWIEPFAEVHNDNFSNATWFDGGKLNISENCIDRHLESNADKTALIWEGDDPSDSKELSYQELHDEVCKFANVLKNVKVLKRATGFVFICQ